MFCSKCGKAISDDADFCQFCGNKIQENERDDYQVSNVKIIAPGNVQNNQEKQAEAQLTKGKKSVLAVIFDYRVYLPIVAVLTIVVVVLGRMNMKGNTPEDGSQISSDMNGITGELSRFIGGTEDSFLKETGLSKNDDVAYPSINDMIIYFDD